MLQRFVCTNKLLFQNAITHGMIKPTALAIALNSIKSSAIWVIIWGRGGGGERGCTFQLQDGKEDDLGQNFPYLLHKIYQKSFLKTQIPFSFSPPHTSSESGKTDVGARTQYDKKLPGLSDAGSSGMSSEEAQVLDTGLLPWSKFSLIFNLTDVKLDALMLVGTDPPTKFTETYV